MSQFSQCIDILLISLGPKGAGLIDFPFVAGVEVFLVAAQGVRFTDDGKTVKVLCGDVV